MSASLLSEDSNRETIEANVKEEHESGEEFIPDIHTTKTVFDDTEIEIKHEVMDYHYQTNTSTLDAFDHSELKTMPNIQYVDSSSVKVKGHETDTNDFYLDLLQCEQGCETCLKYMSVLREHVRAAHAPPQPIQDPLLIHPLNINADPDPASYHLTSLIQVKTEVDENIEKQFKLIHDHEKTHTGEKSKSGDKCGVVEECHTIEIAGFKCDVCEKWFTRSDRLTEHKIFHTGERPVKRGLSIKSFSRRRKRRTNIEQHKNTHTGERPYKCDVCEKSFVRWRNMTNHKKIHTGETPFKCEVCEKCFSHKGGFIIHTRTHTGEKPYQCDVCGECFTRANILAEHKRIHTGENPFKCNACEKTFAHTTSLYKHKRVHTGERPYSCDECKKSFITSSHLTTHKKIHTGKKKKHSRDIEKFVVINSL